jgi:hypothetical protein
MHRTTRQCRQTVAVGASPTTWPSSASHAPGMQPYAGAYGAAPGFMAASPVAAMRYRERLGHPGLG